MFLSDYSEGPEFLLELVEPFEVTCIDHFRLKKMTIAYNSTYHFNFVLLILYFLLLTLAFQPLCRAKAGVTSLRYPMWFHYQ